MKACGPCAKIARITRSASRSVDLSSSVTGPSLLEGGALHTIVNKGYHCMCDGCPPVLCFDHTARRYTTTLSRSNRDERWGRRFIYPTAPCQIDSFGTVLHLQ